MTGPAPELDTAAAVLDAVRSDRSVADAAESRILQAAVTWAAMHSVDSIDDAACDWYGDQPIPLAGPGAPLVAEFSIAEFAIAVGLSHEAGKAYVGEALELRHRLPKTWARVLKGDLVAWKARRIAQSTTALSREAAAHVDAAVAPFAHKIRPTALDHTIATAIALFMPEDAEARQQAASDHRRFDIDTRQTGLTGTAEVHGTLDLADALDLDTAVTATAQALQDLGSTDPLPVRRAIALGQIARQQLTLDLNTDTNTVGGQGKGEPGDDPDLPARRAARKPRQVVLYVHLSDAAVQPESGIAHLGRLENTRSLITAEQIRTWCGNPDTQVTVKPVIDLNDHLHVDAYEVPDRMAEAAVLVDHSCVFPWCTRPARGCHPDQHDADCDHITSYDTGGPTCSANIAPLCRRHHRLKTHSAWTYTPLERGTYLWTSPHGYHYLRDHHGTLDVSRDRPPPRP